MRWLILVIGLSAGLLAALLFNIANAGKQGASDVAKANVVEVIVVAADVSAGKRLVEGDLTWAEWPKEAVHSEFFTKPDNPDIAAELVGSVIRSELRAGMPVMRSQIADAASGYLSSILTPGMRAVALPISAAQTAGGFILPEDRVDVLVSEDCLDASACIGGGKVDTILENVRVLAIDQAGDVETDGTAIVGETATLELSPEDARRLVSALATGTPTLVLRAVGDMTMAMPQPEPEVVEPVAETSAAEPTPVAEPAPAPVFRQDTERVVRVIRNGEARSYELK